MEANKPNWGSDEAEIVPPPEPTREPTYTKEGDGFLVRMMIIIVVVSLLVAMA